jgi:Zn ribbon nucleic-acid-binding protein
LTADQRGEALAALAKSEGGRSDLGPEAEASSGRAMGKASKRGRRPDALGMSGHERVESRGCPHCAGREIIAWGCANGVSRFHCKSCGRTFNALTKTPMAHLRKKERWLDHAGR